jgi:hypothetical protein
MQASSEGAFGSSASADGFNALAGYLFGSNEERKAMAMTMPVEITTTFGAENSAQSSSSMAFVLPKEVAGAPPTPLQSSIRIAEVSKRLVAVKAFPGIVTSEEIARQRTALLAALAEEGVARPVDDAEVITLQYNSPLTLPWRRRNELAVVVTMPEPPAEEESAEEEPSPTAEIDAAEAKAIEALDAEYVERSAFIQRTFDEQRRQFDLDSSEVEVSPEVLQEDTGLDSLAEPSSAEPSSAEQSSAEPSSAEQSSAEPPKDAAETSED